MILFIYAGWRRWSRPIDLLALWLVVFLIGFIQLSRSPPDIGRTATAIDYVVVTLATALDAVLSSAVCYAVGRSSRYLWDRTVATPAP